MRRFFFSYASMILQWFFCENGEKEYGFLDICLMKEFYLWVRGLVRQACVMKPCERYGGKPEAIDGERPRGI